MKVTRLKPGTRAPDDRDRIFVDRLSDGKVAWAGSISVGESAVFGTSRNDHATVEAAEAEAVEWAASHGAIEIIIETDDA